jgi:CcmD family protein
MTGPDRFWFLFAAYAAIWLLLASFLFRLGRRHRALERELRDLATRVDRASATPTSRTDAAR